MMNIPEVRFDRANAFASAYRVSVGAFAFFGPGEFSSIYKSLTRPAANGHIHFAGEALSVRHA